MAVNDRIEQFNKIRTLLDFPMTQRPRAHSVLNQMLMDESADNMELTNTRQAWNIISSTLATVSGTGEYTFANPLASSQSAGKVYFVLRSTGEADLPSVAVPYDDFNYQEYGRMPSGMEQSVGVPEKVSFIRSGTQNQTIKVAIQPVPQAVLNYTFYFYAGGLDRQAAALASVPGVVEMLDRRALRSSMALLPYAEWDGYEIDQNRMRRRDLMEGLAYQLGNVEPIVREYIKQINGPRTVDMDFWND